MSGSEQQQQAKGSGGKEVGRGMEELPLQSSPYVKYKDLEDYKQQGYGTEGHLAPVEVRGGGTDAPTLSGSGLSEGQVQAVDSVNRKGAI